MSCMLEDYFLACVLHMKIMPQISRSELIISLVPNDLTGARLMQPRGLLGEPVIPISVQARIERLNVFNKSLRTRDVPDIAWQKVANRPRQQHPHS